MASTPFTLSYFGVLLERGWAEGITKVRHLFAEIRRRGYTGSFSHLARFLAPWRSGEPFLDGDQKMHAEQEELAPVRVRTAQAAWFRDRVGSSGSRIRNVMMVALARKLLIALWRFVTDGVMPEGAVMRPSI